MSDFKLSPDCFVAIKNNDGTYSISFEQPVQTLNGDWSNGKFDFPRCEINISILAEIPKDIALNQGNLWTMEVTDT